VTIRRIVTGVRGGKSVVVSDANLEGYEFQSVPGMSQTGLWATDAVPADLGSAEEISPETVLPPKGGSRFVQVTFPPDSVMQASDFDPEAAGREYSEQLRDFAACFEPDSPGMHTTPTVDYGILLEGSLVLELDDGKTVELKVGDVVVQNGTRHAWRNYGAVPAKMMFIMLGGST